MKSVYIDCTELGYSVLTPAIRSQLPKLIIHKGDPDEKTMALLLEGAVGVINGHTLMDADFLSRYKSLKVIVFLGTGASTYIDLNAAQSLGIQIRTVRGYGDRTIAEHAFALILAAARHIVKMDRELRRGIWDTPVGTELFGKRLGVIGAGGTGSELIKIATAFGMEVVAWNRSAIASDLPCMHVSLDTLLSTCDVVSLHLALHDETRGILGRDQLALMRQGAILVNVARAALVDERALIDALTSGRLAHAGLDVFEEEPLASDHPFTKLENVTLTSHGAYKTHEAIERLISDGFDLLRRELAAFTTYGQ